MTIGVRPVRHDLSYPFGSLPSSDFAHVTVADKGVGIGSEDLPLVFEPLFTSKSQGTGLGLANARQAVSRIGGHIFIESEVDRGTTVHLFIPLSKASAKRTEKTVAATLRFEHLSRVLIIEDDVAVATGLELLLQIEGIETHTIRTGAETIPAIEEFDPELLILDMGLPDTDGTAVYRDVRARWKHLPIIFSTGHVESAGHDFRDDLLVHLLKPYSLEDLMSQWSVLQSRRDTIS